MKRWARLLILAVAVALLGAVAIVGASAASDVTSGGFKYVSGGVEYTSTSMSFGEVVAAADAGSTVTMLGNYTEESSINGYIATVDKELTLDMGGYTFTIRNRYDNATDYGQPRIAVKTAEGFTVKNGTVVAGHIQNDRKGRAYPFFQFTADNSVLNLENVNSYLSTLFYSYSNKGIKVNITGGEHHSILSAYGCDGGLFDTRASIDVRVTDARFYIASTSWLITSLHQNDSGEAKATSYTFTGCDILTANADTELIKYASEYTTARFYGCNFLGGKITSPTVNQKDTDKGIGSAKDGSIILGVGTAWYEGFVYDSAVAREEGALLSMLGRTATVCYSFSSGNLCDGLAIAPSLAGEYKLAYSLVDEAAGELVSISWYGEDGELIGVTSHVAGVEITPPTLSEYREENNGWYTRVYDGWSKTAGGAPEPVIYSTEDTAFYLTRGAVKAGLKNSKFNLSLMGHVQINLYVPMGMPQGISFLGVYESEAGAAVGTGEIPSGDVVTISSSRYMCYTAGYAGATSLGDTTTVYVKYKVSVDGTDTTLVQPITLSALAYVKAVLADYEAQTHAFPASVYEMVANIVRYSYNLTRFIGAAVDDEIKALYDTYVDALCKEITPSKETTFPSPTVSVGSLGDYMYSIAFEVGSYQPRFRMVFREGSGVTDMKISLEGWYAGRNGEANWREQSFSYNKTYGILYYDSNGQYVNTSGVVCDVEGKPIEGAVAGTVTSDIAVLYSDNIQVYNIDSDLTITLTTATGEVSGQYNLNAYYHGIKDSLTLSKLYNVRKVLMTVREYGESVVRYRFAGGKVTEDTNVETPTVTYSDFGAAGDGVTNDFYAIKATHDYANSHGYKVLGEEGKTYYIGTTGGETVTVRTDTDWCGAKFIIDDTNVTVEMKEREASIFTIANDTSAVTYTPSSSGVGAALGAINAAGGIKKDSFTRLDLGLGYPAIVHLINAEHSSYIRYGENENAGSAQRELVLIDENGYVDESTPLLFDYDKITSVVVIRVDCAPITVGNGELTTVANAAERLYNYYSRNISVSRPNVCVTGISHKIVGEGDTGAPYSGFISVSNANNVVIRDSVLSAHKAYKLLTDVNNTMGTYDLSFGNSNAITCTGVTMHNFFSSGSTPSVYDGYWGIMGSNYCKNLTYDSCKLTRFDAHCGTYNATIRNSDVAAVTLIGGGTLTVESSNVYTHTSSSLIALRGDYGSTWNGEFYLKDVTAVTSSTYRSASFALINGSYTNWNFGYKCYMPHTVTVDNFAVSAASVKTVILASGSITSAGIGDATYGGAVNLNPYEVTRTLVVRNNAKAYTYTLPAAFTETDLITE